MKLRQICEVEVPDEWDNNTPSSDPRENMKANKRRMDAVDHRVEILGQQLESLQDKYPVIDDSDPTYEQLLPTAKWKIPEIFSNRVTILPNNTPNGERVFHMMVKLVTALQTARAQLTELQQDQRALRKELKGQKFVPLKNASVPPAEIQKLKQTKHFIVGGKKIANPLIKCQIALYAGPPEGYPDLTTTQIDSFIEIQNALKEAGLAPLTMIYGGRISTSYSGINFVAIGADGKFAWRKYDPSQGAGQNWVYFGDGYTCKTSDFLGQLGSTNPVKMLKKHVV